MASNDSVRPLATGVARWVQGVQVHPMATKKIFSRHFCWNEAKMGLNLVRCTASGEIKTVVGGSNDHVREGDD